MVSEMAYLFISVTLSFVALFFFRRSKLLLLIRKLKKVNL